MSADTFTIMVSGSQEYQHPDTVFNVLQDIHQKHMQQRIVVVCGDNDGVGPLIDDIAHDFGWEIQKLPHHGECIRTQNCFLSKLTHKPDMMVAFSRKGCSTIWSHIREARGAGIPLRIYGQGRNKHA